jgi:hypothetical protein
MSGCFNAAAIHSSGVSQGKKSFISSNAVIATDTNPYPKFTNGAL